jgi:hypothetical protein
MKFTFEAKVVLQLFVLFEPINFHFFFVVVIVVLDMLKSFFEVFDLNKLQVTS